MRMRRILRIAWLRRWSFSGIGALLLFERYGDQRMIDKQEPTSTPTGRTPSAGPNMQGITFRTDEAAAIRAALTNHLFAPAAKGQK